MKTEQQLQVQRDASRKWRRNHPEKVLEQKKLYYDRHKARLRVKMNPVNVARGQALRQEVIRHLGGQCLHCQFKDWRALQVDHVEGGGREDRSQFKNTQRFLQAVLLEHSGKYQLLCSNCNWIKRYEKDEHRWRSQSCGGT